MKKLIFPLLVLMASGSVFAADTAVKGNIEAGSSKAMACAACHGADGNSANAQYPNLAGQQPQYIVSQLKLFKQGADSGRFSPIMLPFSNSLSEQDMADIAAYYGSQQAKPQASKKTDDIALGKSLYQRGDVKRQIPSCTACHGPEAKGNDPARFPALAGQHPDYTVTQLQQFVKGSRKGSALGIMKTVSTKLTAKEMKAVAAYIATLGTAPEEAKK